MKVHMNGNSLSKKTSATSLDAKEGRSICVSHTPPGKK